MKSRPQTHPDTPIWPLVGLVVIAIVIAALQAGPALGGDLRGNDDMMRMQQVRDLLSGDKSWFDVSQTRLLTPEGGAMHWSRLPDIFLGGIVFLLQPLIGTRAAEAAAVTAWPLFQLAWVLGAITLCLRRLGVGLSGQLAGLFFFCTSFALVSFLPGRIDHHGFGLALTLTAFASLLSPGRTARSAIVAGLCVAAMLTIAIENLPAAGLLIAGFGLAWIVRGEVESKRLRLFGGTLALAAIVTYALDAPGPLIGGARAVCDAYGQSHLAAFLIAGGGLAAAASLKQLSGTWRNRLVLMALAGAATLAGFIAANPDCLGDPYATLAPDVRSGWLSSVGEARALPGVFADEGAGALYFYGFALAGLAGAVFGVLRAPEGGKLDRGLLLGFCAVGFLLSAWQLRAAILAHAFGAIAAGLVFAAIFSYWLSRRGSGPALALFAVTIAISPAGWSLPGLMSQSQEEAGDASDCGSGAVYETIASVPRAIVFTPIDLGAPLIYHAGHVATAAPYHRNPLAIERAISVFKGPAQDARPLIAASGATHLLYCPGLSEMTLYARSAPGSLAAALEAGDVPAWLVPVTEATSPGASPILYALTP